MSYFPCDIPFMSDDELKGNGIRIPKDVPDTNVGNIEYINRQMLGTNLAEVGTDSATKRIVKGFPIDADLLMLEVEEKYGFRARDRLYEIIRDMPKYELPPADVVPVVHAKWENYSPITIKCSRCGHVIQDWRYSECKYCPNCGAKMDAQGEG